MTSHRSDSPFVDANEATGRRNDVGPSRTMVVPLVLRGVPRPRGGRHRQTGSAPVEISVVEPVAVVTPEIVEPTFVEPAPVVEATVVVEPAPVVEPVVVVETVVVVEPTPAPADLDATGVEAAAPAQPQVAWLRNPLMPRPTITE